MSYTLYHWCLVPECKNTSIKSPGKLWIQVPTDIKMRNSWLKLARRDPKSLSTKTKYYLCEDHFDLENDMENYMQYKIMGSVKRIRMKPNCLPSKFDCRADGKRKFTSSEPRPAFVKRQRLSIIREIEETTKNEMCDIPLPSCSQDIQPLENSCGNDKAIQVAPAQEHKAIQVSHVAHYRSKYVQISTRSKDCTTSPFMARQVCIATSPLNISKASISKQSAPAKRKLLFLEDKFESDESNTTGTEGSTVDYELSPYVLSTPSKTCTSDYSSQEDYKKVEKINLLTTLSKVKNKPRLYIGLPPELYFIIGLIEKHTNVSEQNIILCLMRLKLNRTFSQLADDFDLSLSQASNIFYNKLPEIANVIVPLVRQFSAKTIKINLPMPFRCKYNQLICIIDCLEIEIQKPKKAMYQSLTWSEYKKTNTIKYLVACTPDGLVSFISNGYAGRISDVNLVENSKFLDSLPPNACVLADRGFKHLEHHLSLKGFTLIRPPSVSSNCKLSKAEARQTKEIASLRIHVERVIRRLREFGMLKMHTVVNLNLIGMLDLCIKTACALINLQLFN